MALAVLDGNEILQVLGRNNSRPSGPTETTTTGAIANLAAASGSSIDPVTGNITLTAADSGKTIVNSTDGIATLPAATVGLSYSMYVKVALSNSFKAVGTDTINIDEVVSGAAGSVESSTISNFLTLRCYVNGAWAKIAMNGNWNLT